MVRKSIATAILAGAAIAAPGTALAASTPGPVPVGGVAITSPWHQMHVWHEMHLAHLAFIAGHG